MRQQVFLACTVLGEMKSSPDRHRSYAKRDPAPDLAPHTSGNFGLSSRRLPRADFVPLAAAAPSSVSCWFPSILSRRSLLAKQAAPLKLKSFSTSTLKPAYS